jgi:undecaprenyl-diphosphatase
VAWPGGAVCLALFVPLTLAVACADAPYFPVDLSVARAIQSVHGPGMEPLMHAVSLADNNVLGPTALVFAACLVLAARRAWRAAIVLVALVLTGQLLWVACGRLVDRPRPSAELITVLISERDVHSFPSFPSGHAVFYTVFFGFLWFLTFTRVHIRLLRWPLLGAFSVLIVLVGIARLYLGAHWVSDVAGGYLLGAATLAAGIVVYAARHRDS